MRYWKGFFAILLIIGLACTVAAQEVKYGTLDGSAYDPAKEPHPDMFIRHWNQSLPRFINGSLIVRDIFTPLTSSDPLRPDSPGAVLTAIKSFSYATLEPGASTQKTTLAGEQHIYYVADGEGVLTTGKITYVLRQGIGVLVPPGVPFEMTGTGERELDMYLIVEPLPDGFKPRKDILVRDETVIPIGSANGHWTHISSRLFAKTDGLAVLEGMSPVWFAPMTMGQPHSHDEGIEEIWFALEGDISVLLGKQMRKLPVGASYKIPPNGLTWHSNINVSGGYIKMFWFMKSGPHAMNPLANLDPKTYDPAVDPDIDMFIGSYLESNPFHSHGSLIERHILTRGSGDTVKPQNRSAVLKYANRFTHASLMGFARTEPVTLKGEQEIFYVIKGQGTVTSKTTKAPLKPGTAVLAPAGCEFVLENTGGAALDMYLISEPTPSGFRPNSDILVVDESARPYYTSNTHWIGVAKALLGTADGLGTLESVQVVTFDPMTFFHPHSHVEGTEEVWTAIDKDSHVLIGKEVRLQKPGTGYMIPTTGETPHANFNVTGEPVKLFYFARYGDHAVRP